MEEVEEKIMMNLYASYQRKKDFIMEQYIHLYVGEIVEPSLEYDMQ
jgi:hypothetical protein